MFTDNIKGSGMFFACVIFVAGKSITYSGFLKSSSEGEFYLKAISKIARNLRLPDIY